MQVIVEGGYKLNGEVTVAGAKNAALPIMAATLLTADECYLENLPDIEDIRTMTTLLRQLGAGVKTEALLCPAIWLPRCGPAFSSLARCWHVWERHKLRTLEVAPSALVLLVLTSRGSKRWEPKLIV